MKKRIIGASIGTCIHIGGLLSFLKMAAEQGYQTIFLGAALSPKEMIAAIKKHQPDVVALSYRLTPEVAKNLFRELEKEIKTHRLNSIKFIFGGTPAVAKVAEEFKIFNRVFSGTESLSEILGYLRGVGLKGVKEFFASNLVERIKQNYPYPLIRHHFGLPSLEETIKGARIIAQAKVLDVLSIGPDQNAQEHFFHPEEMDRSQDGAGGVPIRKPKDLVRIYQATRCGNFPLVRCYAGTRDLIKWAEMSVKTIHNAWGAIPIFWYSVLDGRSKRDLAEAIRENQATIQWYARRGIPVEVNEAHQWSLRNAHDALAVAMAFLAAYNAKVLGVKNYVAQYMFNTPPQTSPAMDLAKMLAKKEIIKTLVDDNFTIFTQVRAGLASLATDPHIAKGQLAASAVLSLALKPHILHVVGFSEGNHAIFPEELIESCKIAQGVLRYSPADFPDLTFDPKVKQRKKELIQEAKILLEAIRNLGTDKQIDPWTDARVLTRAVKIGLLDTPYLKGDPYAKGEIQTRIISGKCLAIDSESGKILSETARIRKIMKQSR